MSVDAEMLSRRRLLLQAAAGCAPCVLWRQVQAQTQTQAQAPATPRRLALVVGNARYPEVPLNNPVNDAKLMTETLQQLGFEVTQGLDLRRADFLQALLQFSKQIPPGADVLFYYAGHAVQIRGSNYLLPVDIQNLTDPDWVEQNAIGLDGPVMRQFLQRDAQKGGTGLRLLFIDACRDNPFAAGTHRAPLLSAGLASMQGAGINDGNVLIATSSQPNKPAEDGPPGANSVYSAALAREMRVPGQNVEAMLKKVMVQVDRATRQSQLPTYTNSLTAEFIFNTGQTAATGAAVQIVQPARSAKITVNADRALNPDSKRKPRKTALWVFVLRSTAAFQKAGFDALSDRAEATLGPDLLGKEKLSLDPGESYNLPLDLAPSARAIGVLVGYREPDGDGWRALLPLSPGDPAATAPLAVRIDAGAQRVRIALAF